MKNLVCFLFTILLFSACNQSEKQSESERASEEKTVSDTLQAKKEAVLADTTLITPLPENGYLGRVTFTKDEKTFFYFDRQLKKGKIIVKNTEYILEKETYSSKNESYLFSGKQITIDIAECKFDENTGSDCFYGKCPVVKITANSETFELKNLEIQDCPNE